MSDYLAVARTGKNEWWRYLISFPAILFLWFSVGSVPVMLLLAYVSLDNDPATGYTATGFTGVPVIPNFLVTILSFVPLFVAVLLAVRFVHARALQTLLTGAAHVRWTRMFAGAGVWLVLAALFSLVESVLYPGRYILTFQPVLLVVYAVIALILIPVQTSAEELFFRGYLLQWMGLRLKNIWLLALLNGALFFLPHIVNPEMSVDFILVGLGYFAMGLFLAFITLKDNGIELALGMHAANNLFSALLANYTISALPSPSLFTIQILDPVYGLISLIISMILFYIILFRLPMYKRENTPVQDVS